MPYSDHPAPAPDTITPPPTDGDKSDSVIVCTVLLTLLAMAAVGLRFYVRGRLLGTLKSEDWCILVALIFSIGSAGFMIKEATEALGRHVATVSPRALVEYLKWAYFEALCYNLSLCFTKLSILLLYLRVLTHEYIRKATWATIGIVAVYNTWALAMYLTMCVPMQKVWDATVEGGYCHPWTVWWALTYLHIITDFMIFVIPIPVVVTMTIPMRQKAGLLFVFTVGLFVCLISVLRTIWLNQLLYSTDPTWDLVLIANWSTAEINVAIVCGCMPVLRPVLVKVFGPLMDRIFPPQGDTPDPESRPQTIGSMPLAAFRFSRRAKPDSASLPVQTVVRSTDLGHHGAAPSFTDAETNHSFRRKDVDSDAELVSQHKEDSTAAGHTGPTVPAKVYGRG